MYERIGGLLYVDWLTVFAGRCSLCSLGGARYLAWEAFTLFTWEVLVTSLGRRSLCSLGRCSLLRLGGVHFVHLGGARYLAWEAFTLFTWGALCLGDAHCVCLGLLRLRLFYTSVALLRGCCIYAGFYYNLKRKTLSSTSIMV